MPVQVAKVEFLVNGQVVSTDFLAPYEFTLTVPTDVTGLTPGARATDLGGNTGVADDVQVNVVPEPPPTVSLTSPVTSVIEASTITISADATDNVQVQSVLFTVNGVN